MCHNNKIDVDLILMWTGGRGCSPTAVATLQDRFADWQRATASCAAFCPYSVRCMGRLVGQEECIWVPSVPILQLSKCRKKISLPWAAFPLFFLCLFVMKIRERIASSHKCCWRVCCDNLTLGLTQQGVTVCTLQLHHCKVEGVCLSPPHLPSSSCLPFLFLLARVFLRNTLLLLYWFGRTLTLVLTSVLW